MLVVVDEAYLEFVRMDDPVDGLATLARHDNVVLTRTFSKAYGLAGLRVGYAVARPAVAAAIRAVALPFGVSTIAQAAAVASLDRFDELAERVEGLAVEREAAVAHLRGQGWQVPDAQGNFVWIAADQVDPQELAHRAGGEGLSVRPFPEGVRVTIGEAAANELLVDLMDQLPRP